MNALIKKQRLALRTDKGVSLFIISKLPQVALFFFTYFAALFTIFLKETVFDIWRYLLSQKS
jgi:hypothetical protein